MTNKESWKAKQSRIDGNKFLERQGEKWFQDDHIFQGWGVSECKKKCQVTSRIKNKWKKVEQEKTENEYI